MGPLAVGRQDLPELRHVSFEVVDDVAVRHRGGGRETVARMEAGAGCLVGVVRTSRSAIRSASAWIRE